MWGLNHCALSYLKCRAVYHNDKSLMKFLWGTAVATTGYLIANEAAMAAKGASMMGFVSIRRDAVESFSEVFSVSRIF